MIHSIADLLKEFVSAEVEFLNDYEMKHPTTIGTMFEGLTQEIFEKAIFKDLNLKIIKNSFIQGCDTEFDVMLVQGEGEQIPKTDRYKYAPEDIIAIVQSKKNLYGKDIREGDENFKFLVDYFHETKPEPFVYRLFEDSFRSTCRKDIAAYQIGKLSVTEEYVYHSLKIDALLPLRIIWGYSGFKNEYNFRESFVSYTQKNLSHDMNNKIGYFGPHNFPNLIICQQFSLFKANGMPFISPILDNNYWPFLMTSSYNPTYYFLELIWTRLSYKFKLPIEIFGDDLEMEPANRFWDCRIKTIGAHIGWEFNYFGISKKILQSNVQADEWKPIELDIAQFVIINELCKKSGVIIDDELKKFVLESGYNSLENFLESIVKTSLVTILENKMKLLTRNCQCIITPDGKYYTGENNSGRLERWVNKNFI